MTSTIPRSRSSALTTRTRRTPCECLYTHLNAPLIVSGIREAEMVKYACNCFHALEGYLRQRNRQSLRGGRCGQPPRHGGLLPGHKAQPLAVYLKPGFAFGGSCLPKDLRAVTYKARELDVEVPMLRSILTSNQQQIERAVDLVLRTGRRSVGVLGLSFKAGTDDLRESPMVALIETLIGKGLKLAIYDSDVELARLFGANREYIEREIPHISSLMRPELSEVIEQSEVIIIGKRDDQFRVVSEKLNNGRVIIDLVRLLDASEQQGSYQGLCW